MQKKKVNSNNEKSTVMKIKDEFDWGRILYNACFVFNKGLSDHLVKYAEKYDEGGTVVDDINQETENLIGKRDTLIRERDQLHENVRQASAKKVSAFRKYAKAMPVGQVVSDWRKGMLAGEKHSARIEKYCEMLRQRYDLGKDYKITVTEEKEAVGAEREHIDSNHFATRSINQRIKDIAKMVDLHKVGLGHKMADDVPALQELLLSDEQTERLMAVCLNILNTYSEKEFSTMMEVIDREHIAERIYDFFSNFKHNYDFISGCYQIDEETGLLKLKPLDVLANKLYNGYYFTIRGYVQRSYAGVRFEKYNVESVDANWDKETDNGNHGIDRKLSNESEREQGGSVSSRVASPLDEGMLDIWRDCNHFLWDNIDGMSSEITEELAERFSRNPYYNREDMGERMPIIMSFIIDDINTELEAGNVIGSKLKHIILDSMGGAETNEEWRQNVVIISRIMTKYIKAFFSKEKCRQAKEEEAWERVGDE